MQIIFCLIYCIFFYDIGKNSRLCRCMSTRHVIHFYKNGYLLLYLLFCNYSLHPTMLSPECRYDKIIAALDCPGYLAKTPTDLQTALNECLHTVTDRPSLINVLINPMAMRKAQVNRPHIQSMI